MPRRSPTDVLSALEIAARAGSPSAAFIIGRLYDEGWGVVQSARRAMKWYGKAAAAGMSAAYYFVAAGYAFGFGVTRDLAEAFRWFSKAAAAGDRDGSYMMALALFEGSGVKRDERRGMHLLLRAARLGSPDAMDYLAAYHLRAGRLRIAKAWATKAARLGDELASVRLAEIARAHEQRSRSRRRSRARDGDTPKKGRGDEAKSL